MDIKSDKAIKLVAVDLDGTLLDSGSKITDRNLEAVHKCLKNGIKVIITTAKTVYWVKKLILELGLQDPQVASAGSVIIDKDLKPVFVDFTVSDNDNDGVTEAIERFVFNAR